MRRNALIKFLYWTTGLVTGCLLVLRFTKVCHKTTESSRLVGNFGEASRPLFHEQVFHKNENYFINQSAISLTANLENQSVTVPAIIEEWLSCAEIEKIYSETKIKENSQFRKENTDGNKDVFFTKIRNQTGQMIRVVIKHASLYNVSSESERYRFTNADTRQWIALSFTLTFCHEKATKALSIGRIQTRLGVDNISRYRCAIREIENLRKLQLLKWIGIPHLLGSCIKKHDIIYIVTEIIGKPLCTGNGTDMDCALLRDMRKVFQQSQNREHMTLLWLSKVTCFFKQFEEHQVFMEDFSGVNFYFNQQTLDFYIVDADSMIFYNGVRINSRSSCRDNSDCSRPTGNLWRFSALNHKIYYVCQEGGGYCLENHCWGHDAALHTCGVAQWLISPFRNMVPPGAFTDYTRLLKCMLQPLPEERCSIANCCETAKAMLQNSENSK